MDIQKDPPREISKYKNNIDFHYGLRGYYFYSLLMIIFATGVFISSFLPPHELSLKFFKITVSLGVFGAFGTLMLYSAIKKLKTRKNAFSYGVILKAKTVKHYKKFVPWKSSRNFAVIIELQVNDKIIKKEIENSKSRLFNIMPLNGETNILYDEKTKSVLAPIELNIDF